MVAGIGVWRSVEDGGGRGLISLLPFKHSWGHPSQISVHLLSLNNVNKYFSRPCWVLGRAASQRHRSGIIGKKL